MKKIVSWNFLLIAVCGQLSHSAENSPVGASGGSAGAKPLQEVKEKDAVAKKDPFAAIDNDGRRLQVQVMVEYIDLPHKALTKLMLEAGSKAADGTALRMKVQEMVDKDEASILETQFVICPSGQRVTSEAIKESIYPTEYEPSGWFPDDTENKIKFSQLTSWPMSGLPCAFETRNVGSILECEATCEEGGKLVNLRICPEMIWQHDDTVWAEFKDKLGNISQVKMPNFYRVNVHSSCFCEDGQHLLFAVVSPKDAKGVVDITRKIMIFVKCDIMTLGGKEK